MLVATLSADAAPGLRAAENPAPRRFDYDRDTFSFANDTLRIYSVDNAGRLTMRAREKPPEYAQRCFVMCRAALQFFKFVRFEPREPRLSQEEYRTRIRTVCYIPVWLPRAGTEVVIPGYADLRSFSAAYKRVLEQELGNWWPSYFRLGNWRMALPFPRGWQRGLALSLETKLDKGGIQALFLTRFHPINHCVIAYACRKLPDGDISFLVYDPNNARAPVPLRFDRESSSFIFPQTAYFNGGRVNVFPAYLAPWQ